MHMRVTVAVALATTLALVALSAAADEWGTLEATSAALRLQAPRGWHVSEISMPTGRQGSQPVVLVRVSAAAERPLSETADVEIYAHVRPATMTLREWAAEQLQHSTASQAKLETHSVAGSTVLRHQVRVGSEDVEETFLFAGDRALHVAWPVRAATATSGRRVVDSLSFAPQADLPAQALDAPATGVVRPFIVSPSDVPLRADYPLVVRMAYENLQVWFRNAMGNTMTFNLAAVGLLASDQPASWYASNPAGADSGLWFWRNGLSEGFRLTGGRFGDRENVWIYYVDADPPCGQSIGATTSIVELPRSELRGLSSQPAVPKCPSDIPGPFSACVMVGGAGFFLGEALGLGAPPGCLDSDTATACPNTILWTGLYNYPRTTLTDEHKALLATSPFFAPSDLPRPQFTCDKLFAAPEIFR